jgi:predicted nucleic acid-binding protein
MQENVGAAAIYFWGQEMEIARRAAAAGRALDDAGIAATMAETGLPLVGPELEGYSGRLARAARAWMRGRWLPGPAPPWEGAD